VHGLCKRAAIRRALLTGPDWEAMHPKSSLDRLLDLASIFVNTPLSLEVPTVFYPQVETVIKQGLIS
jgi:hypothetical protein